MQSYCIRIDEINEDDYERVREWILKQGSAIGCREYHNGNKHMHIWLLSEKKVAAIRANFKIKFPSHKGNGSYSIKLDDGNLNYICKGPEAPDVRSNPIIFVNTLHSEDDVMRAHESYWNDLDSFQKKKKVLDKKEKNVVSNFQKALDYCKSNDITSQSDGWQICVKLIEYYRVHVKCEPNDFQLRLMAKSIQIHLCYERCKKEDKMHVYDNLLKARAKQIIGNEWIYPSF